jgi:hypothetical protein
VQVIDWEIRDTESNVIMGRITSFLVQVGRVADPGEDLFDVMDGDSSELGEYHAAFFKPEKCDYNDSIRRQFVDIYPLDLLILQHAEIQPAFQSVSAGISRHQSGRFWRWNLR